MGNIVLIAHNRFTDMGPLPHWVVIKVQRFTHYFFSPLFVWTHNAQFTQNQNWVFLAYNNTVSSNVHSVEISMQMEMVPMQ